MKITTAISTTVFLVCLVISIDSFSFGKKRPADPQSAGGASSGAKTSGADSVAETSSPAQKSAKCERTPEFKKVLKERDHSFHESALLIDSFKTPGFKLFKGNALLDCPTGQGKLSEKVKANKIADLNARVKEVRDELKNTIALENKLVEMCPSVTKTTDFWNDTRIGRFTEDYKPRYWLAALELCAPDSPEDKAIERAQKELEIMGRQVEEGSAAFPKKGALDIFKPTTQSISFIKKYHSELSKVVQLKADAISGSNTVESRPNSTREAPPERAQSETID